MIEYISTTEDRQDVYSKLAQGETVILSQITEPLYGENGIVNLLREERVVGQYCLDGELLVYMPRYASDQLTKEVS